MEPEEIEANTGILTKSISGGVLQTLRTSSPPHTLFHNRLGHSCCANWGYRVEKTALITHTFSEVLSPESCSPSQDLLPFSPFGCPI